MAIEIVDFPTNSMLIFHSYVSLPEGMGKGLLTFEMLLPMAEKQPPAMLDFRLLAHQTSWRSLCHKPIES